MPDDKKVRPGQRLRRVSAEQWNGFVDAARAAGERDMGGQDEALGGYTSGVVLRVLNDSGGNLDQFAVVALGVPIVAHSAETELEAFAKPSFTGTAPTADTGSAFGVLQEPLPDGAIGRAMVAGVTWVLVDVTDAAHAFAAATDAVTDKLTSHASAGAQILYKPAGTGDKWCLVRLGDAGGGSGSGITSLNGLTGSTQVFATGTAGTDFAVSSAGVTHTFNLPDASPTARGAVTVTTQNFAGLKTFEFVSVGTTSAPSGGDIFLLDGDGTVTADNHLAFGPSDGGGGGDLFCGDSTDFFTVTGSNSGGNEIQTQWDGTNHRLVLLTANLTSPRYAVKDSGTVYDGAYATVSGLVFKGGLYTSGSLSVTSYTDEQAMDAVAAMIVTTDTIGVTYTDGSDTLELDVKTQMSIDFDTSGLLLENDQTTPGASKYYGTSGLGTKGWHALPGTPAAGATFLGQWVLTSGTTFTTSANTSSLRIRMVGGGGGGGGTTSPAGGVTGAGGGGGGGAYGEAAFTVGASTGYTISIGAGGAAGNSAGGNGGIGGNTLITIGGTTYTAKGGLGGIGQSGNSTLALAAGGAGQVSTSCDVNGSGEPGGHGIRLSGTVGASGSGGPSVYGGGGAGLTSAGTGNAGAGYGGGGGGGLVLNGSTAVAGGAGSQGVLIIEEYA